MGGGTLWLFLFGTGNLLLILVVVVKLVILVVLGMLFFVRGLLRGGVPVLSFPLILLIIIDA